MIVSPSDSNTTGGPAVKIDPCSLITEKSDIGATSAPCPADAPSTAVTSGTRPEQRACASRSVGVRRVRAPVGAEARTLEHHHERHPVGDRDLGDPVALRVARLADGARLHGEVLGRDHHRTAVDAPGAHDERVGGQVRPADERAELLERPRIEEVVDARHAHRASRPRGAW